MTTKTNRITILILTSAFAATTLGLPVMAQSNASHQSSVIEKSQNAVKSPYVVKAQEDHDHSGHTLEREEERFHAEVSDHNGKKRELSLDGKGKPNSQE